LRYDLTDLRLFRAIAEASSLSVGAAKVYLSAGSASARLKNLEHTAGTQLFHRTTRGMDLTPAGEMLLQHVARVLTDLEMMHGELAAFAKGMRGSIRLQANSSSISSHLPRALATFLADNPQVNIELDEQNSDEIVLAVRDGAADLGVLASETESGGLQSFPFAQDRLVIVTPKGHALADAAQIRLLDALDHDFVGMSRSSSNFQFLVQTATRLGRHPNVRIHVDSFQVLLQFVASNVGIALVPHSIYQNLNASNGCAAVELADVWARRSLKIVARDVDRQPPFMRSLLDHLLRFSGQG
jgi:DNA-binding transcriptional LysR family regulator